MACKSPVNLLFIQQPVQIIATKASNYPLLTLCGGNPRVICGFPSQKASNADSDSVSCKVCIDVLVHADHVSHLYCINTEKESK